MPHLGDNWLLVFAIMLIFILEIVALAAGIDGVALSAAVGAIALVCGKAYEARRASKKR
jgi:hypothetical protein